MKTPSRTTVRSSARNRICRAMRIAIPLSLIIWPTSAMQAQVTFDSEVLPMGSGPVISYYTNDRSGINAGSQTGYVQVDQSYLAITNGAQHWDFSQGPTNYVETVAVVNIADLPATFAPLFPSATHALHYVQTGLDPGPSWEFYAKGGGGERHYLGFESATDAPVVFQSDNIDLPAVVTYGMQWSRSTDFDSIPGGQYALATHFTASAEVDGFGDVTLPNLGTFNALRVHEIDEWDMTFLGSLLPLYYYHDYYWLVPGIGKVAEILSPPMLDPNLLVSEAASFTRAFQTTDNEARFSPVHITSVRLQKDQMTLQWPESGKNLFYIIQRASDAASGTWNIIEAKSQAGADYSVDKDAVMRLFRVMAIDQSKY